MNVFVTLLELIGSIVFPGDDHIMWFYFFNDIKRLNTTYLMNTTYEQPNDKKIRRLIALHHKGNQIYLVII